MNDNQQVTASNRLIADGETIRANIVRLFGTISDAEARTGISRPTWYKQISEGEITAQVIGKLYRLDIDPAELIREVEQA